MTEIYTIGHSNRKLEDFLRLLTSYNIDIVVDVRRWPKSSKYPHFNKENLTQELQKAGIQYLWFEVLGGYRKFGKDVNDIKIANCFKSEGFRAYATYMVTSESVKGALNQISSIAKETRIAIMCAEALPWNCHRKIISDWFVSKGFRVLHIINEGKTVEHKLSSCAVIDNSELRYV